MKIHSGFSLHPAVSGGFISEWPAGFAFSSLYGLSSPTGC